MPCLLLLHANSVPISVTTMEVRLVLVQIVVLLVVTTIVMHRIHNVTTIKSVPPITHLMPVLVHTVKHQPIGVIVMEVPLLIHGLVDGVVEDMGLEVMAVGLVVAWLLTLAVVDVFVNLLVCRY